MSRLRLLPLLLCLSAAAHAAPSDDLLLRSDTAWNDTRLKGDTASLAPLLADDWMLTHSDGRVQHKADYLAELATRSRVNQGIGNEDVQVRRYGSTAIVTGTSVQAGTSEGKPWSGRFRFTRVWIERDGKWVMVSSHSSRIAP